jgi:hypothetical protein
LQVTGWVAPAASVNVTVALVAFAAWNVTVSTVGNWGGRRSWTVTLKVAEEEFPSGSDATQVTIVVPSGNVVFGRGTHATFAPEFPVSIAVGGMKNTTAPAELVACAVMSSGTVSNKEPSGALPVPMSGGVTSARDGSENEARN